MVLPLCRMSTTIPDDTDVLQYNLCSLCCCIMQVMEPWVDTERWNPMMDDFLNENFNICGIPVAHRDSGTVVQLFISGIPSCLTEDGLRNLLSSVAKIRNLTLIAHKNIGFVTVHQNDALKLITYFRNYKLGNSFLNVRLSKPRGTASGTSGEVEQKKNTSSSSARFVDELALPTLAYPTAAKYVQVGQELAAKLLSVASPSQFFICRDSCDDDNQMTELHTKMRMHYSSLPPRTGFRPNGSGLYAALKRDSDEWFRVQALDFDTESVLVLYLDYGTHDRVGLTKLQSLEGPFLSFPFRAICCSLSNLRRPSKWSEEATVCMRQLLSDVQQVQAKVCEIDGYNLSVELILSSGQTVNDILVNRKYANYVDGFELSSAQAYSRPVAESDTGSQLAELSEDTTVYYTTMKDMNFVSLSDIKWFHLDIGKTYEVWVTDSADVENFYVQLSSANYPLIDEQLKAIYSSKSGGYEPQQSGELIALHLDSDDTWYRASVKEIGNKKDIKCQLIDFGISVTTTSKNISCFDSRLLTHPVAAFKCSFHDVAVLSADLWKHDYLKPIETVYDMTVVDVKNDLHFVELVERKSNSDLKQQLIGKGLLVKATSSRKQSDVLPATGNKPSPISTPSDSQSSADRNKQEDKFSCPVIQSESVLHCLSDTEVKRICLSREKIRIVHVDNPASFYIQSGSDSVQKKLERLHQSITNFCRQPSHKPDTVAIGQVVGMMHDDGIWYRGQVADSESGGKFQVQFVDYGIMKTADSTVLRPLPDSLAGSLPRQAIHCAIDRVAGCEADGNWSLASVNCFKNMCQNCDFILKSVFTSDFGSILLVDLLHMATGQTAKDMLLAHQLAMPKTNISSKLGKSVPDVGEMQVKNRKSPLVLSSLVKNAIIQAGDAVTVTCIHSPCRFFIQQQEHRSSLQALQDELNSYYRTYDLQYCPQQVGELVAVMHNNCWNRAEVLSSSAVDVKVFFIDYGNTVDSVNNKNIRALPLQFATALPKLAVCCALGGTCGTCNDGSFSEVAVRWLRDNYLQVTCTVTKVKYTDSSDRSLVNLKMLNSDRTVRQSLLEHGMAFASTGDVPYSASHSSGQMHSNHVHDQPSNIQQPCAEPTALPVSTHRARFENAVALHTDAVVSVVHAVSPVDFYVISSAAVQQVLSFSEKLEQYCGTSDGAGYSPQYVGEPVAAKFEGQWYRAEVVKLMSSGHSEVFFVDFGNTEVVNTGDLHSLPVEFVNWPKQAVHCGIDHICGTGTGQRFTESSVSWFKEKFACSSDAILLSVHIVSGKHMVNMSVHGDSDGAMELLVAAELARYSDL